MTDEDKRWLAVLGAVLGAFVVFLVIIETSNAVKRTAYYQCVYNIKSVGITPTDIKAICER